MQTQLEGWQRILKKRITYLLNKCDGAAMGRNNVHYLTPSFELQL